MPAKTTKKKEETSEMTLDEMVFYGGEYNSHHALKQLVNHTVQIENLSHIMQQKKIEDFTKLESLMDMCAKFNVPREKWAGMELETVKQALQDHFYNEIQNPDRLTANYRTFFGKNEIAYKIDDLDIFEDQLQNAPEDELATCKYRREVLGLGVPELDKDGNELPYADEDIDEVTYEILHYYSHLLGGDNIFLTRQSPDFSMELFEEDNIYIQVSFKNPLDLV